MKKTLVLTAGLALGMFGATSLQARQVCHNVRVKHIQSQDNHRLIGTGVGAVAGGLLGHQVGGGKGKTLATVGGAVAGGVGAEKRAEQKGLLHDRTPLRRSQRLTNWVREFATHSPDAPIVRAFLWVFVGVQPSSVRGTQRTLPLQRTRVPEKFL